MSEQDKPPPKDEGEYSAFKELLDKIAKVPKTEIDQKEREYQDSRDSLKKKIRASPARPERSA